MKLGCCGSSFPYLRRADGVVKAVFVALVLATPFDALNAKGFAEERSGVPSNTNSFLYMPKPVSEAFVGVAAALLPM